MSITGPELAGNGAFVVLGAAINSSTGNSSSNGVMVAQRSSDGLGIAADTTSGNIVLGVNFDQHAIGDTVFCKQAIYRMDNSSTSPVVVQDVGKVCYVETSSIVAHAGANSIVAGTVKGVDANGVFVKVGVKENMA